MDYYLGAWQAMVTKYFYFMEKSYLDILLNFSFYVRGKKESHTALKSLHHLLTLVFGMNSQVKSPLFI